MANDDDLVDRLRRLGFRTKADALGAFLIHAHKSRLGPTETVEQLVDLEERSRVAVNLARRTRFACLGSFKPLDRFVPVLESGAGSGRDLIGVRAANALAAPPALRDDATNVRLDLRQIDDELLVVDDVVHRATTTRARVERLEDLFVDVIRNWMARAGCPGLRLGFMRCSLRARRANGAA